MNALYRMPEAGKVRRQPYRVIAPTIIPMKRRYEPSVDDFIQKFHRHLKKWHSETAFTSSLEEILEHPSYLAIVSMDGSVKDLLIFQLRRAPGFEVYALEDICGYAPYGEELFGNIKAMSDAWISESETW